MLPEKRPSVINATVCRDAHRQSGGVEHFSRIPGVNPSIPAITYDYDIARNDFTAVNRRNGLSSSLSKTLADLSCTIISGATADCYNTASGADLPFKTAIAP